MRTAFHCFAVVAALCFLATPSFAQQSPLETKEKAVIQFEFNLEKITQSELGKKLGLADKLDDLPNIDSEDIDPNSISRVYGALSLPEDIAVFEDLQPGDAMPMEMFSRVEINDGKTIAEALAKMAEKSEEVTIGNKTFMKPTAEDSPEGMLMQQADEKTIEMGTAKYLTRENREVMSDGLNKAWDMAPDHAIRLVVDVAGMESLKEGLIERVALMAPQGVAYAELLNNIDNLRLTIDLDGKDLLTLSATGKDEELAEEFADGINSLLLFAKLSLDPAGAPTEQASKVFQEIKDSLDAGVDGNEVSLKIPRPEGFGEVIEAMLPPGF